MSREIVQRQQESIGDEVHKFAQAASKTLLEGVSTSLLGGLVNKVVGASDATLNRADNIASYGDVVTAKAQQIARELDNGDQQGAVDALHHELCQMSPPEFKRLLKLTASAEQRNKGADLEIVGLDWPNGQKPNQNEKRYTKNGGSLGDFGFSVDFHRAKTSPDKPTSP